MHQGAFFRQRLNRSEARQLIFIACRIQGKFPRLPRVTSMQSAILASCSLMLHRAKLHMSASTCTLGQSASAARLFIGWMSGRRPPLRLAKSCSRLRLNIYTGSVCLCCKALWRVNERAQKVFELGQVLLQIAVSTNTPAQSVFAARLFRGLMSRPRPCLRSVMTDQVLLRARSNLIHWLSRPLLQGPSEGG